VRPLAAQDDPLPSWKAGPVRTRLLEFVRGVTSTATADSVPPAARIATFDYPSARDFPEFHRKYGPRGVTHSWATDKDDPTTDPRFGRWPGKIAAGTVSNEIVQHHDWLPTFLAMAGDAGIKDKLLRGHEAAGKRFRVHLDGYNLLPYLTGQEQKSPRQGFIYFDDDGNLVALRFDNWKVVFMEQRAPGTLRIWAEPFVALRLPKIYNLRTDPFERADITSNTYYDWFLDHDYIALASQSIATAFVETFKEFPPRQRAASFTIDQGLEKMAEPMRKAA